VDRYRCVVSPRERVDPQPVDVLIADTSEETERDTCDCIECTHPDCAASIAGAQSSSPGHAFD
jgi:hypothetical protein